MDPLVWVVGAVGLFWLVAIALRSRGLVPDAVQVHGPLVTLHTKRGRRLLNWLAGPKRFWRAWGNFGLGIAVVVLVGSLLFLVVAAVATVQNPPPASTLTQPRTALVIPGYNPFLPWSAAPEILFGLVLGLVVHEGGHGILCRVEDIEVESLGLLFITLLPAGAFVEPDQESQEGVSRGSRSRMFAAGVTNNFAVTVIAFALLFGPVVGSLGVVSGATVMGAIPGSPADRAGVEGGAVIVGVGNQTVASNDDLTRALRATDERTVAVELDDGTSKRLTRSVVVTATTDGPLDLPKGATVASVNGTPVATTRAFERAVANRTLATVALANETTVTAPVGAYVTTREGYPLADAGAPTDPGVVTRIAGHRIANASALQRVLDGVPAGERVAVELYHRGTNGSGGAWQRAEYNVTLGESPDGSGGFLGVYVVPGTSGVSVTDFGVETYPAGRYLGALGGTCAQCPDTGLSFVQRTVLTLELPVIGVVSAAYPFNFAGFTGSITNFYVAQGGPLSGLGAGALFLLANVLFWVGWINLNLGVFNCVPTFLLDGGHILRTGVESVAARLPVDDPGRVVTAATVGVQLVMLASLVLVLFGAQLLN